MALEEQVSALVSAANNLTETVNSKIGEIDKKVDDSIEELNSAFPVKYQEYSQRVHYVDCVAGNDKNSGLTKSQAFKTLAQAFVAGIGAGAQDIYCSVGRHIVNTRQAAMADIVTIYCDNQNHYPSGVWSNETSTVFHIDKRSDVKNGIYTKLFGNLYINAGVFTFEGRGDEVSVDNGIFYGVGNIGTRVPLFSFDSVNRCVMTAGNNYNPFSSFGAELPQFEGEAAYYVKGSGSTCILNLDRAVDRTAGMQMKYGSVVVLS
ncbi:hypothetical protein V6238_18305 [Marinomonas arenicola]|uniref:hypothetical protein n=1 Tax=Marinomonas arenicola TaxID=569601 RepID=UPI00311ED766